MSTSFDYAVVRVVPRVDREEFVNAGVILFCLERRFLQAEVEIDRARLAALWPALDLEETAAQLEAIPRICAGLPEAGPIAQMPLRERFHWLVAPRSTVIQVSPVHTGISERPEEMLRHLHRGLVLR